VITRQEVQSGGEGDSPNHVLQFEVFCERAQLATMSPLDEVIVLGDRKTPTEKNQLAWLQLNVSCISAKCGMQVMYSSFRRRTRWTKARPEHN
jgi:hypothetical protein